MESYQHAHTRHDVTLHSTGERDGNEKHSITEIMMMRAPAHTHTHTHTQRERERERDAVAAAAAAAGRSIH